MVRIRQILCPIDFSDFSRHAFDCALAIARAHQATVVALHVYPAPAVVTTGAVPFAPAGPEPFHLPEVDRASIVSHLARFVGVDIASDPAVQLLVVEAPSVNREILVQADRLAADMIVIGTHGRSGFERLLLGSTTEKVLRRSTIPVLTVPMAAGAPPGAFAHILCAVDFSPSSLASLDYASALAAERGSRLTLMHVVELMPVVYEPTIGTPFDFERDRPALERASLEALRQAVPEPTRSRHQVQELVVSGKPYVQILKKAGELGAELIVLGVHGHNVIDRLMFGSTSAHVVRAATCPVLAVRDGAQAAV